MEKISAEHNIAPLYDEHAKILILGSFPSVKSREAAFFYAHPQNRFWRVLSAVLDEPLPRSVGEKRTMLLRRHVALWDVIDRCEIEGSSDASISAVVPTDIGKILAAAKIGAIFCNGGTAGKYYERYQRKSCGREAIVLPSTSAANARWSQEALIAHWRGAILPYL